MINQPNEAEEAEEGPLAQVKNVKFHLRRQES